MQGRDSRGKFGVSWGMSQYVDISIFWTAGRCAGSRGCVGESNEACCVLGRGKAGVFLLVYQRI